MIWECLFFDIQESREGGINMPVLTLILCLIIVI